MDERSRWSRFGKRDIAGDMDPVSEHAVRLRLTSAEEEEQEMPNQLHQDLVLLKDQSWSTFCGSSVNDFLTLSRVVAVLDV